MLLAQVGLTGPAAGWVADVDSICRDLVFAKQCAEGYAAMIGGEDHVVARALWNAGLIAYRRALNTGRGHLVKKGSRPRLLDDLVPMLSDTQKETHELAYEMANQHVAHRVGDHELASVGILLNPPSAPRGVAGVALLGAHMIGPELGVAEKFAAVCEVFLNALEAERSQSLQALQEAVIATGSLDELYAKAVPAEPSSN